MDKKTRKKAKKRTLKKFLGEIREKDADFRKESPGDRLAGFLSLKNPL